MRGSLFLLLVSCSCRAPDPACQALSQYGSQLDARLHVPQEASNTSDGGAGLGRALTPAVAQRLLQEVQLLQTQLPSSTRDEHLAVVVRKLNGSRAALEKALQEFLAIDAKQLEGGIQSGATMPIRRGVAMSRNALVTTAATAIELCEGRD